MSEMTGTKIHINLDITSSDSEACNRCERPELFSKAALHGAKIGLVLYGTCDEATRLAHGCGLGVMRDNQTPEVKTPGLLPIDTP